MKRIFLIVTILSFALTGFAQVWPAQSVSAGVVPARGGSQAGGTHQSIAAATGGITISTIVNGTVTPMPSSRAADTLQSPAVNATGYGTDSGYVLFGYSERASKLYILSVKRVSGTLAGAALLQGSYDGQTWYTLTGNTTYCTSCIGASATLSGTGTTKYSWYLPTDADNFTYHQLFPILSGTCTATFTGQMIVAY